MSHRSRRQTNTTNGMLVGLLLLVTVVAAAEGYLLYQNSLVKPKGGTEAPVVTQKPVYDLHNYGNPKLLTTKEVQDGCLLLDDQGNPIVASRSGNLIRVRLNGGVDLLGGTFPSLPPTLDTHELGFGPPRADFALDPNGNLFSINPETKSIRIYSKSGTRVGDNIGRGQMTSPVRIAVNASEIIFVIDNHKLYRIDLEPATGTIGH